MPRKLVPASRGAETRADPVVAGAGAKRFRLQQRPGAPLGWALTLEDGDGGVAVWSLPNGLPWAPDDARPAEPADDAPPGSWDEGRCAAKATGARELVLHLDGKRVKGTYALRARKGAAWNVERLDPASVRPFPDRVLPMLATLGAYPDDEAAWAFELKWDGIRALAHVREGRLRLRTRNLIDVTAQYPELAGLAEAVGRDAVLDGEIVALDERGRSSFQLLQGRLGVSTRSVAARKAVEVPATYMAFDVLHLDGHDVTQLPYEERRALLDGLGFDGPAWRAPPASLGSGRHLLGLPGIEGLVAKRLGTAYVTGARSPHWRKVKTQRRQELVIGGYTHGRGSRAGTIGSLMVGHYDVSRAEADAHGRAPRLVYAGNVGTGFTDATLAALLERFAPIERETSPFDGPVDKPGTFVEPILVGEFEFTEWTRDGRLRHPSFKGLRGDKDPRDVVREDR